MMRERFSGCMRNLPVSVLGCILTDNLQRNRQLPMSNGGRAVTVGDSPVLMLGMSIGTVKQTTQRARHQHCTMYWVYSMLTMNMTSRYFIQHGIKAIYSYLLNDLALKTLFSHFSHLKFSQVDANIPDILYYIWFALRRKKMLWCAGTQFKRMFCPKFSLFMHW